MNSKSNLDNRLSKIQEFNRNRGLQSGLERLNWHIQNSEYDWDHQIGGKLPRNHMWRPLRFCVQDVLLGMTVLRHNRNLNCLEVDVFLTASIPEYESDCGSRALTLLILSEAYKCGGSMEVQFSKYVENQTIPLDLVDLAASLGIFFKNADRGIITPTEAKRLYIALTGFSDDLESRLNELEQAGRISSAMTCYAIHHGIWDRREVEAILLSCPRPASLLTGYSKPEQRHLYLHDLVYARTALLFGCLDRNLRYRSHPGTEGTILLEDDERDLKLTINGQDFSISILCFDEPIQVPWVVAPASIGQTIPPGKPLTILVRARGIVELEKFLRDDFKHASDLRDRISDIPVYVLVPRDYEKLSQQLKDRLLAERPEGVGLMVSRDFVSSLDEMVARKLKMSGVMRA